MDAAIAEMNAEMDELFGAPPSAPPSQFGTKLNSPSPAPASAPARTVPASMSLPSAVPQPIEATSPELASAAAVLKTRIAMCSEELSTLGLEDAQLDRGERLVATISACAAAAAELQKLR